LGERGRAVACCVYVCRGSPGSARRTLRPSGNISIKDQQVTHTQAPPPGVYFWDISTVSLHLAISNHVAAAAVLSLSLSTGTPPAPVCAVVSFIYISNHLASFPSLHHSHRRQSPPHLRPALPRVHPLPQQPAVFPGGRRFGLLSSVSLRGLYERSDGDDSMSDFFTAEHCRELVELGP